MYSLWYETLFCDGSNCPSLYKHILKWELHAILVESCIHLVGTKTTNHKEKKKRKLEVQ